MHAYSPQAFQAQVSHEVFVRMRVRIADEDLE